MLTAQALTPLNLHQATCVGLHILCRFQPRLGHTRPPLVIKTRLIGQTCPHLITKKRIKSLWVIFYGMIFVAIWVSKILHPNRQTFVNILGRLLHVWWLLARGVQVRIFGQKLLIKVPVLRLWSSQHGTKRLWNERKLIPHNIIYQIPAQKKLAIQVIQALI